MRRKLVLLIVITSAVALGAGWLGGSVTTKSAEPTTGWEPLSANDPLVRAAYNCQPAESRRCVDLRWELMELQWYVSQRDKAIKTGKPSLAFLRRMEDVRESNRENQSNPPPWMNPSIATPTSGSNSSESGVGMSISAVFLVCLVGLLALVAVFVWAVAIVRGHKGTRGEHERIV